MGITTVLPASSTESNNMEPEQFIQLQNSMISVLESTIEKTVNGKIRNLDKKIDDYITVDKEWKKEDEKWKNAAQPGIDLGKDALSFGKVMGYIFKGAAGAAVLWGLIKLFK